MANFGRKIDLDNGDRGRRIWFASDLHYGHQNILNLNPESRSRFGSIDVMDDWILEELSSKISSSDILFILGDLIWKESPSDIKNLSAVLPVNSYRVIGNHDGKNLRAWGGCWSGVYDLLDVIIKWKGEDIQATLSHYPILDWNHRYRGSWNIHGHCHGNIDALNNRSGELRLDIGFDSEIAKQEGSFLIPFETVYERMKEKTGGRLFREWANEEGRFKENLL